MTKKLYSIHIDEDVYELLREEQTRRQGKIPLRQLVRMYLEEGLKRDRELNNFDTALRVHLESVEDSKGFIEYLNSSMIANLIRFLDDTRPSYSDIGLMAATIIYHQIKPKEFFKTLTTYAKFGLSSMKDD